MRWFVLLIHGDTVLRIKFGTHFWNGWTLKTDI
jgi:hypothetical protein